MLSQFHYGTTRLYVSMSALYLEDLHNLIAEMIDDPYRGTAGDPVFRSQKTDGPLSYSQHWRIVKKAARRAGAPEGVSPHWFRHAHASHALHRGAPAHLVQQTLGYQSLATTSRYTHARPDDSLGQYLGM